MITAAIDFSMNSPAVFLSDGTFHSFTSLFNSEGRTWDDGRKRKAFEGHVRIAPCVRLAPYTRLETNGMDYVESQRAKLDDACHLAALVMSYLPDSVEKVVLEGFSFNSKGSSYIDLVMYNSFLRKALTERFGTENIVIVSPAEVKKFATGKGNATKERMVEAFVESADLRLSATSFHALLREDKELRGMKPVDDLVDAYWLHRYAEAKGLL